MKYKFKEYILSIILILILLVGISIGIHIELYKQEDITNSSNIDCIDEYVVSSIPIITQLAISEEIEEIHNHYVDVDFDIIYQDYLYSLCDGNDQKYYIIMAMIYHESHYNINITSPIRSDGSCDMGLVQMNSKYLEYEQDRLNYKFDPYNPYDAIKYISIRYDEEYEYWSNSESGINLIKCILGSYNKGRQGYNKYKNNNGYDYYYTNNVLDTYNTMIL